MSVSFTQQFCLRQNGWKLKGQIWGQMSAFAGKYIGVSCHWSSKWVTCNRGEIWTKRRKDFLKIRSEIDKMFVYLFFPPQWLCGVGWMWQVFLSRNWIQKWERTMIVKIGRKCTRWWLKGTWEGAWFKTISIMLDKIVNASHGCLFR